MTNAQNLPNPDQPYDDQETQVWSFGPLPDGLSETVFWHISENQGIAGLGISNGPFGYDGTFGIWGHEGPLEDHTDDAGMMYGLVLYAKGDPVLIAPDGRFALKEGDVWALNTDEMHGLDCNGIRSLLLFLSLDFYGQMPTMSPRKFFEEGCRAARKICRAEKRK